MFSILDRRWRWAEGAHIQVCFISISNSLLLIALSHAVNLPGTEPGVAQGEQKSDRRWHYLGESFMSEKPCSFCEVTWAFGLAVRSILPAGQRTLAESRIRIRTPASGSVFSRAQKGDS